MMLSTLGLEASDLVNKKAEENHLSLKSLIVDTRIDILDAKMSVTTIQDSFMDQSLLASSNQSMLVSLSDIINGEVVLPLKSLGDMTTQNFTSTQQMLRMASDIRGMLPSVDTRFTYFQAPVKVEDALGRFFPMPSEYSFDDLLSNGDYEFLNGKNRKQIISTGYCERRGFLPGSTLTMVIILDDVLKHGDEFYPMPRCGSRTSSPVIGGGRTCDECGIWFDSDSNSRRRELSNLDSSVFESPIVDTSSGSETPLKTSKRQPDDVDDLMAFRNIKIGGIVKLKGNYKYGYKKCDANTDLCQYGDTCFLGRTGKAFVFTNAVNISLGKQEEIETPIGRYIIRNISCRACATEIGWRYDYAQGDAEKYPEG
ncbi:hypothetical protein BOTNAR_0056g00010 [Botryotinia narcissicola]|uniref:Yippee domain-containing protein n=1 Tax=Botryotinia narcissicola TaxID=278944 RepID=A0A4Z1J516_9HELO|nr:hypothetical protein BOTNAR_0056g00010 [Botryotinia narcissicola]